MDDPITVREAIMVLLGAIVGSFLWGFFKGWVGL